MAESLTIELSDAAYDALRAAAEAANTSPEQLVASTVAERLAGNSNVPLPSVQREDPVLQIMRERGHLVDPRLYPPLPGYLRIPSLGTPELQALLDEIEADTEDEVNLKDVNLADFVER